MAPRALIVWSVGIVLTCATVAFSATNLFWRAPDRAAPEPVAVVIDTAAFAATALGVTTAPAAIDLPSIDPPAELAGFDPAPSAPASAGFALVSFLAPSAAWTAPVPPRPAFQEQRAPSPGDTRSAIREIVREEMASLAPDLGRLSVRPPPRPAFLEARVRADAAPEAGIVEVRSPSSLEGTGSSLWTWAAPVAPPPSRSERSLQSGMASWYGPGFHGRKTASGERFDQNALTAAHRSLPFGTKVRVVDQTTGRSIVVRINDRGPFAHGRVIDLSKASAAALGMGGLARVQIVSAE